MALVVGSFAVAVTGGDRVSWGVAAVVAATGVLGLLDDARSLPALSRLGAQLVIAGLGTLILGALGGFGAWSGAGVPEFGLAVVATLLIVAATNAFNFMDGIDGITGLSTVVCAGYLAALTAMEGHSTLSALSLVVAGAALGFLPANLRTPRVFLGDSGSYALGAATAVIVVLAVGAGTPALLALAALFVYGLDTGVTFCRRLHRGERVLSAHRDHVYQQLSTSRLGHLGAATVVGTASALVCSWALVVAAAELPAWWTVPWLIAVGVGYVWLPSVALPIPTAVLDGQAPVAAVTASSRLAGR
ncbi:MAG: hypothetical protein M3Q87_10825 [Actinomycetota bacterium]|nr:hypothetical protein [Actinomycetota bacterium]